MPLIGWRGPVLALAGAAITASALIAPEVPTWLPLGAAGLVAVLTALRDRAWVVAVLLPLLAAAAGGWWALAGWTLAAISLPLAWAQWRRVESPEERDLRENLRLSRHEIGILRRHLDRYPQLLEACTEFSQARGGDELAVTLLRVAQGMVPGWTGGRVHLGTEERPPLVASSGEIAVDDTELVAYATREDRSAVQRDGDRLLVVLPLRSERRSGDGNATAGHHGALSVAMRSRGSEDMLVLDLLRALARLGGLGLAAVDLVARARELALHDDLTGLFGRHEFFRRLEEALAVARRSGEAVAVIMCDLDHLKRFNDRWGHAAGDTALRAIAKAIRDVLPTRSVACRYGGEEFAILLSPRYAAAAGRIAETLLDTIRGVHPIVDEPTVALTASMGWALAEDGEDPAAVLERADAACYRAKQAGRDRVEAAS